ncbi:MAG: hypothetical protein U0835_10390 [Isosphaeraceae bacterium]
MPPRCSLHALYRYAVQDSPEVRDTGLIPFDGFVDLMEGRFEQAISSSRGVEVAGAERAVATPWASFTNR